MIPRERENIYSREMTCMLCAYHSMCMYARIMYECVGEKKGQ